MSAFAALLALLLVLIPLVLGVVLIVKSRGGGLGYPACGNCHYDLRKTVGTASLCPECGAAFLQVGVLPPGGRRNRVMLWGGIVLAVLPFSCIGVIALATLTARQQISGARQAAMAAQQRALAAQTQAASTAPATTAPDQP